MRGCIGKNSSFILARDKAKIEFRNEGQPSPHELAFGVELGPSPHSKNDQHLSILNHSLDIDDQDQKLPPHQ